MKRQNDENSDQPSKKQKFQYQFTIDDDIRAVMKCLNKWDKSKDNLTAASLKDFIDVYPELYDFESNVDNFINYLDLELNNIDETVKKINTIVEKLEEVYPKKIKKIHNIWASPMVEYNDLLTYFPIGSEFIMWSREEPVCGTIVGKDVYNGFFKCTEITWSCFEYCTSSHTYDKKYDTISYGPYKGSKNLSKHERLDIIMKTRLENRGNKFDRYTRGIHHLNFNGSFYSSATGNKFMIDGRVMVDQYHNRDNSDENLTKTIPSYQIYPFIKVYDLTRHHIWGTCSAEYLTDIE